MNSLQQTIHLVATDEDFRAALLACLCGARRQADSEAALAEQDLALSPEEMDILTELEEVLALPVKALADHFQRWYLSRRKNWK